jgi:hypothetical protein
MVPALNVGGLISVFQLPAMMMISVLISQKVQKELLKTAQTFCTRCVEERDESLRDRSISRNGSDG